MIEVINKIIKYSRRNKTYPGATLDQIKHIEIKCGYSLPSGYSELYSTTNGGRLFNNELLEIDDVIELLNDNTYIEKEDMIVFPTDYVKKVITYKNRIPLFKKKNDVIFIDLYPDRSLFSFIPKENKSRNRLENNWDYCLTYPFENYTGNTLVSLISSNNNQILNGILSEFCEMD